MFGANINLIAVVVAAAANMALGFVWYAPFFLGKQWMAAMGKTHDQLGSPGPAYALTIVGSLVASYVTGVFVNLAKAATPGDGALVGLVAGIGFVMTSFGAEYLFAGRSRQLYLINVGYQVIGLVVMGVVHGLIR